MEAVGDKSRLTFPMPLGLFAGTLITWALLVAAASLSKLGSVDSVYFSHRGWISCKSQPRRPME